MPLILRPIILSAAAVFLLLLMFGSVVLNYHQLQQVRDLRDSISLVQAQGEQLHNKRQALKAQVSYELSRDRIGFLQQRYLPQLRPLEQFTTFDAVPFRHNSVPLTTGEGSDTAHLHAVPN